MTPRSPFPMRVPWLCTGLVGCGLSIGLLIAGCDFREAERAEQPLDTAMVPETVGRGEQRPVATDTAMPFRLEPDEEPVVTDVDDRFWSGPSTAGYELTAEFVTHEAMTAAFDLDATAVAVEDREWTLGDILVSVDFSLPGDAVTWRVAGEPAVVTAYVERLAEQAEGRGFLLDLGVLPLDVRHCCRPTDDTTRREGDATTGSG